MNRDFEIRQILRAYRGGLMSEAAFEEEMSAIEHNGTAPGASGEPRFQALGRIVRNARQ